MTRIEAMQGATWRTILKVMLTTDEVEAVKDDVREFFGYRNGVPIEARNGILIRVIMMKRADFNAAYLRKTQESFKARGLLSASAIINHLDRIQDYQRKQGKNHRVEPNWMDDYISDLQALEQ